MLRAEELMVGDWVYCEGQPTPENVTIQTIAEDGVWFNGPNYEGVASYDRIFPIPITPEILEKNGFEKLDFSHFQIGDRRLVLDADGRWDGPLSWHWVVTEMGKNAKGQPVVLDYYVATINHVHELQRALRCVGLFELANNIKL